MGSEAETAAGNNTATSGRKRPTQAFSLMRGFNLPEILQTYKKQREAGQFPSAAFLHAEKELEWIPANQEPTAEPIAPFLTTDEIKRLSRRYVMQIMITDLPARSYSASFYPTAAEVEERKEAIGRILKKNGAKTDLELAKDDVNAPINPRVVEIKLTRRHDKEIRGLKQRRLPYHHPLYGISLPLDIPHERAAEAPDRGYPHTGSAILCVGGAPEQKKEWLAWSGLHTKYVERIPNCSDMPWVTQLHEVGHVMQGPLAPLRGTSMDSDYRIEMNAQQFALESYRRYNAGRGRIELMLATDAVKYLFTPLDPKSYDDHVYWYLPALMSGKHGCEAWPLYRSSAAITELHHLCAAVSVDSAQPYRSNHLNALLKETFLSLHENPPQKNSQSVGFTYRDLYKRFNRIAQHQEMTEAKAQAVKAFNTMAKSLPKMNKRKKSADGTPPPLLRYMYKAIWESGMPLHNDTLLLLGMALESMALFNPSLKTKPAAPLGGLPPRQPPAAPAAA
jgi:hypothetical protein